MGQSDYPSDEEAEDIDEEGEDGEDGEDAESGMGTTYRSTARNHLQLQQQPTIRVISPKSPKERERKEMKEPEEPKRALESQQRRLPTLPPPIKNYHLGIDLIKEVDPDLELSGNVL